jgi:hypothetical protein
VNNIFNKEKKMKKLIVLVAAMVMIAGYANAAEWNFYGSARVSTFWTSIETIATPTTADVDNFAQGLQGNSRVGANVKVSDELSGRFEAGNSGTTWNTRLIYGEWNFGGGTFLVGQTYTPLNLFYSNQVFGGDTDLLAYGGVYSGRAPQLRLKFGGFQIAAVAPAAANLLGAGGLTENKLPTIEAAYSLKMGAVAVKLAGGYNSYENSLGVANYDIDAYAVALGASASFGMIKFGGNIYSGQNSGQLIWTDVNGAFGAADGLPVITGTQVRDNDVLGYVIVATAKLNDMFSVEFGYAGIQTELDAVPGGVPVTDDASSYYAQAVITLAPGVYVIPEVGVVDYDEIGQTKTTYFGAKWQINF